VVVLFDGVKGKDPVADLVLSLCRQHDVRVAVFEFDDYAPADRFALYGALDRLRAATPLAVSDLIMTLDGTARGAAALADEVKQLGRVGAWSARGDWMTHGRLSGFGDLDVDALRLFYMAKATQYGAYAPGAGGSALDAKQRAYAWRVISALAAMTAAQAAMGAVSVTAHTPPLSNDDPSSQPGKLLAGAGSVMGSVVCLDYKFNAAIRDRLQHATVQYRSKVLQHVKAGVITMG
jgi:hypothetical protein